MGTSISLRSIMGIACNRRIVSDKMEGVTEPIIVVVKTTPLALVVAGALGTMRTAADTS